GVVAMLAVLLVWWWGPRLEKHEKDIGLGLRLPIELGDRRSLGWLGAVVALFVDASIFASLVYSYFYLWTATEVWPPVGYRPLVETAAIASVLLLALAVPAAIVAHVGAARGAAGAAILGLLGAAL